MTKFPTYSNDNSLMRESPKMSTCSKKKIDLWLMVEKFQKDETEIVVIAKQASLQHYHKVSSAYQCCQAIFAILCSTALGSNVMATLIGRDHFTIMLNVPTRFRQNFRHASVVFGRLHPHVIPAKLSSHLCGFRAPASPRKNWMF